MNIEKLTGKYNALVTDYERLLKIKRELDPNNSSDDFKALLDSRIKKAEEKLTNIWEIVFK